MILRVLVVGLSFMLFVVTASSVNGDGCWKYGEDHGPKDDPYKGVEPANDDNSGSGGDAGENGEWSQNWECTIGAAPDGRCNIQAEAKAEHRVSGTPLASETHTANASHTRDGVRLKCFVGWQEDTKCAATHGAPTDARTQGAATGMVVGKVSGNCENGSGSANPGVATTSAFARVSFSGVENGHAEIDFAGALAEGGAFQGSLSWSVKETGEEVQQDTENGTVVGTTFFSPELTKTCNLTYATPAAGANIGADQWQVQAAVTVSATCMNRAAEAYAKAKTSVQSFSLFLNTGGTGTSCDGGGPHSGHGAKKVAYPPTPP